MTFASLITEEQLISLCRGNTKGGDCYSNSNSRTSPLPKFLPERDCVALQSTQRQAWQLYPHGENCCPRPPLFSLRMAFSFSNFEEQLWVGFNQEKSSYPRENFLAKTIVWHGRQKFHRGRIQLGYRRTRQKFLLWFLNENETAFGTQSEWPHFINTIYHETALATQTYIFKDKLPSSWKTRMNTFIEYWRGFQG